MTIPNMLNSKNDGARRGQRFDPASDESDASTTDEDEDMLVECFKHMGPLGSHLLTLELESCVRGTDIEENYFFAGLPAFEKELDRLGLPRSKMNKIFFMGIERDEMGPYFRKLYDLWQGGATRVPREFEKTYKHLVPDCEFFDDELLTRHKKEVARDACITGRIVLEEMQANNIIIRIEDFDKHSCESCRELRVGDMIQLNWGMKRASSETPNPFGCTKKSK